MSEKTARAVEQTNKVKMEFHIGSDEERDGDDYHVFAMNTTDNNEWNQQGISTKIPPMFDGRTSWFQYEELIDDWVDLTTLNQKNMDQR